MLTLLECFEKAEAATARFKRREIGLSWERGGNEEEEDNYDAPRSPSRSTVGGCKGRGRVELHDIPNTMNRRYRGEQNDILNAIPECESAALAFFVNFIVSGGGILPL